MVDESAASRCIDRFLETRDDKYLMDALGLLRDVCKKCDGDGYVESFDYDHSNVVITLCTDCGPATGDFDR